MNIKALLNGDVALVILVKPGQKKEGLVINDDDSIVLRINAPAMEGKANIRVVEFLSEILRQPKRDIVVTRGELSRHKEIRIRNTSAAEVLKSLRACAQSNRDDKK